MRVKEWESWFKTQLLKNWDHSIQSHYFTANRSGKSESSEIFFPKSLWMVTADMKLKDVCFLEGELVQT